MSAPSSKAPAKTDQAKVDAANQANADADAAAAAEADTAENHGKLVVLMRGFVARTDAKNPSFTKRYRLGDEFEPIDGIHDVDSLIDQKVIGRVGDGTLQRTTALAQAQAAAKLFDEDSPVVDLEFQPFSQQADVSHQAALSTHGEPIVAAEQGEV